MQKPLPNRMNYVITHDYSIQSEHDNLLYYNNILSCVMDIQSNDIIESIYVIGGAIIYQFFFDYQLYDELILSYVHNNKTYSDIAKDEVILFPSINFKQYYIHKTSELINVYDKKSEQNQLYSIYFLKKYDHLCQHFINSLSI